MREPSVHEWILRGLVASCISAHTLYRWYVEQTGRIGVDSVSAPRFYAAIGTAHANGLIYVQSRVTCYEHTSHAEESGWSLTDAGVAAEATQRNEEPMRSESIDE